MGYQKMMEQDINDENMKKNFGSVRRTSKTEEMCNNTSKCQYDRLMGTGKPVGTHPYSEND